MPIRFSTEAANADFLGEDPGTGGAEGAAQAMGEHDRSRDRHARGKPFGRDAGATEAKPGKDINAAGFIKDKDAGKP